jgi:type IV secretory pathway TraG/TraD family ATPase VirD4
MRNISLLPNCLRLFFLMFCVEMVGQVCLCFLGVWQVALPWTSLSILKYGFLTEVLTSILITLLISIPLYFVIFSIEHRQNAAKTLGGVVAFIFFFATGFIIYHMTTENSTPSLSALLQLFNERTEEPKAFALFLAYEGTTFAVVIIGVVVLLTDSFKSPKRVVKGTAFDQQHFGSAMFADKKMLEEVNAYNIENGPIIGQDDFGSLYMPLLNKLTISPPGVGKTTASSIPVLLTHDGPVFAFDVKGELWAVTARFRTEVLGRKVVAIDPFGISQSEDFQSDKPDSLKSIYRFNPFDFVPEDPFERDRMINSFASSFVINEGGASSHFDDNAKILIRGYIDYLMSLPKSTRSLPALFNLMSESLEESLETFDAMAACQGKAGAAANQISRVGSDERGSILSTSYRQIDWIGDRNIQQSLSESNFDLRDFVRGNMDIFVILPADQTKEHNRLFRMTMSLLMNLIVTAKPSELPKKKMLFLLEELAQLGACPDVEQCIEIMRARGVVVWSVFQSLKQIKMFSKPDLFLSVPIKQIFTNDDVETMKWVQDLGGKKTVISKSLSINKGDSQQHSRAFSKQASQGESESVQESGTDLISLNEIRELPLAEQFVFIQGSKPVRCKKVRYFEHQDFFGKFDGNPLEKH